MPHDLAAADQHVVRPLEADRGRRQRLGDVSVIATPAAIRQPAEPVGGSAPARGRPRGASEHRDRERSRRAAPPRCGRGDPGPRSDRGHASTVQIDEAARGRAARASSAFVDARRRELASRAARHLSTAGRSSCGQPRMSRMPTRRARPPGRARGDSPPTTRSRTSRRRSRRARARCPTPTCWSSTTPAPTARESSPTGSPPPSVASRAAPHRARTGLGRAYLAGFDLGARARATTSWSSSTPTAPTRPTPLPAMLAALGDDRGPDSSSARAGSPAAASSTGPRYRRRLSRAAQRLRARDARHPGARRPRRGTAPTAPRSCDEASRRRTCDSRGYCFQIDMTIRISTPDGASARCRSSSPSGAPARRR